jgi:hypothetical protein
MPRKFSIDDRVAYSAQFLRATGQYNTGVKPNLRGVIKEIKDFGEDQLCVIQWDNYSGTPEYHDDGFGRVIIAASNLILVKQLPFDI